MTQQAKGPKARQVSAADFADLLGVHRNTVGNWIRDGLPVKSRRGRAVQLELAAAFQWVRKQDAAAAEARIEKLMADPDYDRAEARKMIAAADMAEMERDKRRGELVPTADVEERWASVVVAAREAVMAVPGVMVQDGTIRPSQEAHAEGLLRDALTAFGQAAGDAAA